MYVNKGLVGRVPTVVDLYSFARYAGGGLNLFSFFGLGVKNCPGLENSYTDSCSDLWLEARYQGSRDMNRTALTQVLARVERRIANYVGYWPAPYYVEDERHHLPSWNKTVVTKYSRVPVTGTRRRVLQFTGDISGSGSVPMTSEFISVFDQGLNNVIRYTFGNGVDSLGLPAGCNILLYPENSDLIETGSGPEDTNRTRNEGYLLRPYTVIERSDTRLVIDVPLVVAVKPELYMTYPDIKGVIRSLDACNEDNFIERIAVYSEIFERPDGYVRIARRSCNTCNGGGCDACNLPQVPVCLIPASSEYGIFSVRPIRNTGTDNEPCWEISDTASCCQSAWDGLYHPPTFDQRWACNQYCTKPLELCLSYVSSCENCYGDDCLHREPCPELLEAIANITMAEIDIYCDCTCFRETIARLREEYALRGKGFSRGPVTPDMSHFALGSKVGHVEAFLALQNVDGKHRTPQLGWVG